MASGKAVMGQNLEQRHVIVVDDDPLMRWFLGQMATDAGRAVTEADGIETALDLVRQSPANLDLIWLNCPRMYADLPFVSAIKHLRPACRIVLMTPVKTDAFVDRAIAQGVDQVVVKPVDAEEVRTILKSSPAGRPVTPERGPGSFRVQIPRALQRERERIGVQLERAAAEGGAVGEAARRVERLLRLHATSEEQFALPPLGLLPMLAAGLVWPEMSQAIAMAANLTSDLPQILEDHASIVVALQAFEDVAQRAGRPDLAMLAQSLAELAEIESEVLYPAAIVTGKFLEMVLSATRTSASGAHGA
jgi:DNA-binding NarL/FixJ family response regulator